MSAGTAVKTLAAAVLLVPFAGFSGHGGEAADGALREARASMATRTDTLPDVTLENLDGERVQLRSAIRGPAVINFWATWCGPCRREMPELAKLHREMESEGLQVVGIAVSSGSPEEIRAFAERHGAEYLLLRASREWARRNFRMFGMPTTLIVDGEGRIRERLVGPQSAERLRRALAPLLSG